MTDPILSMLDLLPQDGRGQDGQTGAIHIHGSFQALPGFEMIDEAPERGFHSPQLHPLRKTQVFIQAVQPRDIANVRSRLVHQGLPVIMYLPLLVLELHTGLSDCSRPRLHFFTM